MSSIEGTTKRPPRLHAVLTDDVEARIADYLTIGDLCRLRATQTLQRRKEQSGSADECKRRTRFLAVLPSPCSHKHRRTRIVD